MPPAIYCSDDATGTHRSENVVVPITAITRKRNHRYQNIQNVYHLSVKTLKVIAWRLTLVLFYLMSATRKMQSTVSVVAGQHTIHIHGLSH